VKYIVQPKKLVNLKVNLFWILSLLLIASLMMSACAGAGEPEIAEEAPIVAVEGEGDVGVEEEAVAEDDGDVLGEESAVAERKL
jgi:hypothetical protein